MREIASLKTSIAPLAQSPNLLIAEISHRILLLLG
jgi:hypothetical protein